MRRKSWVNLDDEVKGIVNISKPYGALSACQALYLCNLTQPAQAFELSASITSSL